MPEKPKKINVFVSYAREDADDLQRLKEFLQENTSPLLNIWDDGKITAGTEWDTTIKQHLQEAQIILLLISQYFLNSSYIEKTELKTALEKHASGQCRVIPIFAKHCNLLNYAQITKLQGLPKDMRFLSDMGREIDAELTKIQIDLNEIAASLLTDINIAASIVDGDEKSGNAVRIGELINKRKIFLSLPATPEGWKKRNELIIQADGERNYNDWPYEIVPGVKEAQAIEKMNELERGEALAALVRESIYSIHLVQSENDLKEYPGKPQYDLAKGQGTETTTPVFRSILWLLTADLRSKLEKEFCMNTLFTGNDYGELFAKIASLDQERDKEVVELKKAFQPSKKVYMYYDFAKDHNNPLRIKLKTKIEESFCLLWNTPGEDAQKQKEDLEGCEGALIFYGAAEPIWYVVGQANLLSTKNLHSRAVCLAEPEIDIKEQRDVSRTEFITIRGEENFDTGLHQFLNLLK